MSSETYAPAPTSDPTMAIQQGLTDEQYRTLTERACVGEFAGVDIADVLSVLSLRGTYDWWIEQFEYLDHLRAQVARCVPDSVAAEQLVQLSVLAAGLYLNAEPPKLGWAEDMAVQALPHYAYTTGVPA